MKCGVGLHCMHSADWERVQAEDWSRSPNPPDYKLWDQTIDLGDRVEPLGFDSIWSVEHFATPYGMVPNALQHLAFWAGRTKSIDMGTSVVVLPWHHPVQVAHEIAMLDILLQGRNYTIGVGRGLSPKEFGPLGIPQEQARQRFVEALDIIKLGLSSERFSYDGEIFQVPETSIRPQPRHKDLWSRAVGGFVTQASLEAVAKAGLGPIVVSPQSFEKVGQNMALFNTYRQEVGLSPDAQPLMLLWAYCVENESEAEDGRRYFTKHAQEGALHYGFADAAKTFGNTPGYEQYAKMPQSSSKAEFVPGGELADEEHSATASQLIGTPAQIIEMVEHLQRSTGAREIQVMFDFGGMPHDVAVKSMELFSREVLPAIHELPTPPLDPDLALAKI